MVILDLQLVIFLLLLGLVAGVVGGRCLFLRRAPEQLRIDNSVWRIFEELPFSFIIQAADGTVTFANNPARQLLDTTASNAEALLQRIGAQPADATSQSGMLAQPWPLRWWRYPLVDRAVLFVLTDDREHHHLLRQQQGFIGQLSHELRTPLTALIAHTEIARNPRTNDVIRQASLETIQRETQRMTRLTRDLLELYRLETAADFPLQPTNLLLVAETAIAQIILQAEERGIDLALDADQALPRVLANPDRITQVFVNLLDNALKYSGAGATIRVRLKVRNGDILCIVQDSGPGIPATDLPRVTERLYRGRTDAEGSGMGLTIVNEILRRHHTSLTIESTTTGSEMGTTCSWTLRPV